MTSYFKDLSDRRVDTYDVICSILLESSCNFKVLKSVHFNDAEYVDVESPAYGITVSVSEDGSEVDVRNPSHFNKEEINDILFH